MKRLILVLAGAAACAGTPDTSATSNARATEVLDRIIGNAGGDSLLAEIFTLAVQYDFIQPTVDGIPTSVQVMQARDFGAGRNLYEVYAAAPVETHERVVMEPGRGFSVNLLTGEVNEYDTPAQAMAEYSELQLRWYVHQPLTQARANRVSLRHLGTRETGGQPVDVISYLHDRLGEVQLEVDSAGFIIAQQWNTSDAVPRASRLLYQNYQPVGDYLLPFTVVATENGRETARYEMTAVRVNAQLNETAFQLPQ